MDALRRIPAPLTAQETMPMVEWVLPAARPLRTEEIEAQGLRVRKAAAVRSRQLYWRVHYSGQRIHFTVNTPEQREALQLGKRLRVKLMLAALAAPGPAMERPDEEWIARAKAREATLKRAPVPTPAPAKAQAQKAIPKVLPRRSKIPCGTPPTRIQQEGRIRPVPTDASLGDAKGLLISARDSFISAGDAELGHPKREHVMQDATDQLWPPSVYAITVDFIQPVVTRHPDKFTSVTKIRKRSPLVPEEIPDESVPRTEPVTPEIVATEPATPLMVPTEPASPELLASALRPPPAIRTTEITVANVQRALARKGLMRASAVVLPQAPVAPKTLKRSVVSAELLSSDVDEERPRKRRQPLARVQTCRDMDVELLVLGD
ncbi:unnamed protein product [Mycena citricolor]|uniref:Uncharacterized protein n=1 Tax=Mycena citricolor TaxID=2018698 RepID=A0AAD2HM33_9AGAR|nr:unnamed protein product [Mycena citricolor]